MRHFFASVSGESHRNDDGTDRQAIIAGCRVGDPLLLIAEPDNDHDENAIKVLREDGKQIGYVEAGMAAQIVRDLSDFSAFVAMVRRPGGSRHYGVALLLVTGDGEGDVEAYARRVLAEGADTRDARRNGRPRPGPTSDNTIILIVGVVLACALLLAVGGRLLLMQGGW